MTNQTIEMIDNNLLVRSIQPEKKDQEFVLPENQTDNGLHEVVFASPSGKYAAGDILVLKPNNYSNFEWQGEVLKAITEDDIFARVKEGK